MKKFTIPILEYNYFVYFGIKEFNKWKTTIKTIYKDDIEKCKDIDKIDINDIDGAVDAINHIYIGDTNSVEIIAHEIFHFIKNLEEVLGADGEEEFQAYLMGFVFEQVYKYINKLKRK
jgi:hypothetical protein